MAYYMTHHWEDTLEGAQQWLEQEQRLGYTGQIRQDGDKWLVTTWGG